MINYSWNECDQNTQRDEQFEPLTVYDGLRKLLIATQTYLFDLASTAEKVVAEIVTSLFSLSRFGDIGK